MKHLPSVDFNFLRPFFLEGTILSARLVQDSVRFCTWALVLVFFVGDAKANPASASTLPGQASGAPIGSFQLSALDNVNLFNGHLNFRLPLLEVRGRGQARFSLGVPIDQRWLLAQTSPDVYNPQYMSLTDLTPGHLGGRQVSEGCDYGVNFETQTQTILAFTTSDGTEIELRDGTYGGQPALSQCNPFDPGAGMALRGRSFGSDDGSLVFVCDANLYDNTQAVNTIEFTPSGYLLDQDGTRYRINQGRVEWISDSNGNLITFSYEYPVGGRLTGITDSLNRQITIAYSSFDPMLSNTAITYKGFGGAPRTINIDYEELDGLLIEGTITTYQGLFGAGSTELFNPRLVKRVILPDNRTYELRYNKYGELSRVELPSGGILAYQWSSGNPQNNSGLEGRFINRRVIKKSIYEQAGILVGSTSFGLFEANGSGTAGSVKMRRLNDTDLPITDATHHFHGIPIDQTFRPFGYTAPLIIGREYQTDINSANGSTLLLQVAHTFDPGGLNILQTLTTLADVSPNLISKQTFVYDQFNNLTDIYEYDFGQGSPGLFLRRSHTDYVTNPTYTGTDPLAVYAGNAARLRRLPSQRWVSSDLGGANKVSLTAFEYDNYASDSIHAPLISRSNISGLCTAFDAAGTCNNNNSTTYTTRGNATTVTSFTNALLQTGPVTVASQYDIAGNMVKAIDARGFAAEFDFGDRFGLPDGEARSNTPPMELSSQGQMSYAFTTQITNALGHTIFTQYDYHLGAPVNSENENGTVTSVAYSDLLDRPTQTIRAVNRDASVKSQTSFGYDDIDHFITSNSDQYSYGDSLLQTQTVYDGLGRTTESRQYEGGGNYIAVQTQYDAMGRAFKVSNPFRPWQSETPIWTTTVYDALSRVTSVTTPDSAVAVTSYSGNQVTVTDQAGKQRRSLSDALGRLIQVYEAPNDANYNYLTSYSYDTLDNLITVNQGSQTRTFAYDSLKRLTSATNPESGTVSYQYDNNGNLRFKTDARSIISTYVYDVLNRNTTVDYSDTAGVNPDITRIYDTATNGKGRLRESYAGGTETTGANVEHTKIQSYDALGRPVAQVQRFKTNSVWSAGYQTERTYNLASGVTSQTYPSGRTVSYTYDSTGRTASFTGNLGGASRTYSTGITYSPFGGMTREQFGTDVSLYHKLLYNSRGQVFDIRLSSVNDTWDWNRGRLISYYTSSHVWGQSGPGNNGNVLFAEHWIPPANATLDQAEFLIEDTYTYDALNRLNGVSESSLNIAGGESWTPRFAQRYLYDRYGNRRIDINPSQTWGGVNSLEFEVETGTNRLYSPGDLALAEASRRMQYDPAGNLKKDTYTGAGDRVYDAENRMTKGWGGNNQWQEYTYNADGQRVRRKVNGVETSQVYGMDGELLAEYAQNGSPSSPQKEYGYRNGQLLVEVTVGIAGWGPPPVINDNPLVINSTTVQARHITELRTAIDALRSHYAKSPYPWSYSATTSDWISANPILEMRTALDDALGPPSPAYSAGLAIGQPIKKDHIQELRDRVLAAWNSSSGGTEIRWLVADQLGTPRIIIDKTGALANVSRHDYLPFGEELPGNQFGRTPAQGYVADTVRQQFTSKERDNETGLDYFINRYYSSTQGRFTSADPIPMTTQRPADPQQLNLYAYVRNNPLRYNDPYGLDLYATGEEAERFRKDLEKATKLKLKLDTKTGKITINGKLPKNMSDAAKQISKIIGDTKNTVRVDAIRDSSPHDYVGGRFNDNGSQTINYADFDQLSKGGKGGLDSPASTVHETTEAYAGLTEKGPGKTVLDFHKTGISYENMVRSDRGLGARRSEVSDSFGNETFVTVDYTTHVEHYTLVQTGQGKFAIKEVKVEKKKP